MVNIINQGDAETTEYFHLFVDEMCAAFQCLRKRASVILNAMRLMLSFDIPGLNESALHYVEEQLMMNQSDNEAGILLTTKIAESVKSLYPRLNFIAHTIAQGDVWQLVFGNSITDFDHSKLIRFGIISSPFLVPFNLEDCSKQTDGEIVNVYIQGVKKMRDTPEGTKVYLYECTVTRKNMIPDPLIMRSYEDFRNFYLRLCCKFPEIGIPTLGQSRYLGRTNVKRVAEERRHELQNFLQMLFCLPVEISHVSPSFIFEYTFSLVQPGLQFLPPLPVRIRLIKQ
jgi:phosphatidylinositol-4-phosphate 3-kinase